MKKILLTTNHPAPYINRWIDILKKEYDVEVLYYYERSTQKKWKGFVPLKGSTFKNSGLFGMLKLISRTDLVISGGWSKYWYFLCCIWGKISGTPVWLFSDYPEEQKRSGFKYFVKKTIFTKLFKGIFGATKSTCDYYKLTYGISSTYTFPYMGIREPSVMKDYSSVNLVGGQRLNIFIANNFIKRKGYASIWRALSELSKRNILNKLSIVIAGDGEEFHHYKKKFDSLDADIKLLGWIENDEYDENMKKADVYIHASDFEPFGIPPIDAMKRGMVLIASDGVKSVNGVIENGKNGFIFPKGDGVALADNICAILKQPKLLGVIGDQARKDVCKHYNDKSILKALEQVLLQEKPFKHTSAIK